MHTYTKLGDVPYGKRENAVFVRYVPDLGSRMQNSANANANFYVRVPEAHPPGPRQERQTLAGVGSYDTASPKLQRRHSLSVETEARALQEHSQSVETEARALQEHSSSVETEARALVQMRSSEKVSKRRETS